MVKPFAFVFASMAALGAAHPLRPMGPVQPVSPSNGILDLCQKLDAFFEPLGLDVLITEDQSACLLAVEKNVLFYDRKTSFYCPNGTDKEISSSAKLFYACDSQKTSLVLGNETGIGQLTFFAEKSGSVQRYSIRNEFNSVGSGLTDDACEAIVFPPQLGATKTRSCVYEFRVLPNMKMTYDFKLMRVSNVMLTYDNRRQLELSRSAENEMSVHCRGRTLGIEFVSICRMISQRRLENGNMEIIGRNSKGVSEWFLYVSSDNNILFHGSEKSWLTVDSNDIMFWTGEEDKILSSINLRGSVVTLDFEYTHSDKPINQKSVEETRRMFGF